MLLSIAHRRIALVMLGLAALAVAGCREEEQGRILQFEKGTYLGRPDTPIDDATRGALQDRTRGQKF